MDELLSYLFLCLSFGLLVGQKNPKLKQSNFAQLFTTWTLEK